MEKTVGNVKIFGMMSTSVLLTLIVTDQIMNKKNMYEHVPEILKKSFSKLTNVVGKWYPGSAVGKDVPNRGATLG